MSRAVFRLLPIALVALIAAPAAAQQTITTRTTTTAVTCAGEACAVDSAAARFHAALAAGDSATVARLLAPDAVILESGGQESRAEYFSHHYASDVAFARAVPSTNVRRTVTVRGDVAWVTGTSESRGTFRDQPVNSRGAELMVLVREGGEWRIAAVHWSSRRIPQTR